MRKEDKIKKGKDDEIKEQIQAMKLKIEESKKWRKTNIHAFAKLIVYEDIVKTQINTRSESIITAGKGIYSQLLSKDEILHMYDLIEKINSNDFIELIKKTPHGKEAIEKFNYFGRYGDIENINYDSQDRLFHFIRDLQDEATRLKSKLEGYGVVKTDDRGSWRLNLKAKRSTYTGNIIVSIEKLAFLLDEIEYAVKDLNYKYTSELMFYAGRLYEKAKVIVYESDAIRGLKIIKATSKGGKNKGLNNKKRAPDFQKHINEYMKESPKYAQACVSVAEEFNVCPKTIRNHTHNPSKISK